MKYDGAVSRDDIDVWFGNPSSLLRIKDIPFLYCFLIDIRKKLKRQALLGSEFRGFLRCIYRDTKKFSIPFFNAIVMIFKGNQLAATKRSPKASIENHHQWGFLKLGLHFNLYVLGVQKREPGCFFIDCKFHSFFGLLASFWITGYWVRPVVRSDSRKKRCERDDAVSPRRENRLAFNLRRQSELEDQ